jgi:hypothetical protein
VAGPLSWVGARLQERVGRSGERVRGMGQFYLALLCSLRVLSSPSLDGRSIAVGHIRVKEWPCWAEFGQLTFGAVVLTLKATG